MTWEDPIVKEVHESREKLASSCHHDMNKIGKMLKSYSEKLRKEGWTIITKNQTTLSKKHNKKAAKTAVKVK